MMHILTGKEVSQVLKFLKRGDRGARDIADSLVIGGHMEFDQVRDGRVIDAWSDHNIVVNQGLNSLLDVYLRAQTQITSWYMAIFEGNYTPLATDTAASIVANATETTTYNEATRQLYVPAVASSQSITNAASRATFTMNNGSAKIIYGAFLSSVSTKSATTGIIFAAAKFAVARTVVSADLLLGRYALTASSS